MNTPGRAYALRRLAETKRRNSRSVARGGGATIGGKHVSGATYTRKTGVTKANAKRAAKRKPQKGHGGKFGRYSTAQLRSMASKAKKSRTGRKTKRRSKSRR